MNPSEAAAKLCKIYEEIVRAYSEIKGGNEDWINEAGIRGNDAHYANFGGVPLDNLSQLYPYPEKPNLKQSQSLVESESSDLLTDLEEDGDVTQLEESSRIYDETTQLESSRRNSTINALITSIPSSQLIFEETQLICCDRLIINTQELEKLAAINDSIDKELAELEMKLATTREEKEEIDTIVDTRENVDSENNASVNKNKCELPLLAVPITKQTTRTRIIQSSKTRNNSKLKDPVKKKIKKEESNGSCDDPTFDPASSIRTTVKITGITTTGVKDEKSQIQLAKFSDKFNYPILPDFQGFGEVSHVLIPTGPGLIVKKRTMKYFEAILLKKEIISLDWISTCLKSDKLSSPTPFKIKGDEIGIKQGESSKKFSDKIFSNYKFYLYGEFSQPPRDQLERLINATQTCILSNVQELSRGTVILADPSAQFTFEKDAQIIKKYPIVGTAWFLDSISCGRALEFHGYFIL